MTQLTPEAKRVSSIVDEIADYNCTISTLEYQICDVPESEREEDTEDLQDEQKRLQDRVTSMVNNLKDDDVEIVYDGRLTQVKRNDWIWLECYEGQGGYGWIEYEIEV